jgi:hypothetical protein
MQDNTPTDQILKGLIQKSQLEMPFSDFEENLMQRILKETNYKTALSRDKKLSFFFFIIGTLLGLVINFFFQKETFSFLGVSPETGMLLFQVIFVLLFLTQLDGFLKLAGKLKRTSIQ